MYISLFAKQNPISVGLTATETIAKFPFDPTEIGKAFPTTFPFQN